ncbi:GNAT family N-acetyltransferase [Deinococcus sonorensis]|uniref:GNAT family N-acetyltransferase n=2 Tax=Deinococcus sonorensis TaxID=309891 RepID=A0AAU7U5H2_9DEIO
MTHPRRLMRLTLRPQTLPLIDGFTTRAFRTEDLPALAALMLDAYRGTVDFDEGASLDDAFHELHALKRGEYGMFMPSTSRLVDHDGRVVAAVLVTLWGEAPVPFVAFTMTAAAHKRKGLARLVLSSVINTLLEQGHQTLDLVVTRANTPAVQLYERLGFQDAPRPVSPKDTTG